MWYLRFYYWVDTTVGAHPLPASVLFSHKSVFRHWHGLICIYIFIIEKYNSYIMNLLSKLRFSSLRHRWRWNMLAILLGLLVLTLPYTLKLFGFPIFRFLAYLMKVILETLRVSSVWYLFITPYWNVNTWKLEVHNDNTEVISFVLKLRSQTVIPVNLYV